MSSIKTLIDAYIKRNANQEITGPVLNGVLTAIADALGTPFIGEDGYWYEYDQETGEYVSSGTPAQGESGVNDAWAAVGVSPDPQPLPSVDVIYDPTLRQLAFTFYDIQGPKGDQGTPGITGASVSVDANVGTPSVDASIVNSILTLAFHNLRGAAAGFGTPTISVGANQGTPSASVTASGPDTAKVFNFAFDGLKGETGPQGPQGPQGNPGSSQDYPFTLANNLTTDDSTVALTAAMGVQLEGEVSQLSQEVDTKADQSDLTQLEAKVDGFDTKNYTEGLILKSNGATEAVEGWGISDFIPYTSGGHITWNYGGPKRTSACLLFYNDAKEFISGAYWPASNDSGELSIPYTDINTYAPNAAFIRASYRIGNANAAVYRFSVEIWKPQDIHTPGLSSRMSSVEQDVSEMQGEVGQIDSLAKILPNKLDKVMGTNLVNPDEILSGAALPWNGTDPYTGLDQKFKVSGYIPVNEKNIISNAYSADETWATMYVYDAEKNFLRNNGTNQQYTYQEGDAFVRISFNSTNVKNWKANYGTILADYAPYTDYKPLQDLDVRVTAIEDKIGTVDYDYTAVALFKSLAVVGDSYSSGAIYGVSGAVEGRHDGMAWLNIMARRNGIQSTGLYATPAQNTTKFLDPTDSRYNSYGLGALLSDTAKDLYFIMLGINAEPDGVGVGTVEDCNVDWTQNATSFCGNIGKIIGNIKTHAPNAKIVCIVANMLFSNLNPATNSEKRAAIIAAAEFYGVAWMEAADNPFFSSTFYVSQLHTNHPVGTTYAGMAVAFEKLLSACIQTNPTYFVDYVND